MTADEVNLRRKDLTAVLMRIQFFSPEYEQVNDKKKQSGRVGPKALDQKLFGSARL